MLSVTMIFVFAEMVRFEIEALGDAAIEGLAVDEDGGDPLVLGRVNYDENRIFQGLYQSPKC